VIPTVAVSDGMVPLPEVLYLTGAGVPLSVLCTLALRGRETGKAARCRPKHAPSNTVGSASALGARALQCPWADAQGV
jgi:hypothetical protein